jgi:hypothetical protein
MKRRNDQYNVGNDYLQSTSAYFLTTQEEVDAIGGKAPVYSDGLYHYTTAPVYELSGGVSALNKRVFTRLPQDKWEAPSFDGAESLSAITDTSAVFSPDYSTAEYDFETDNTWNKK